MSYTELDIAESYDDPILTLARDANLNKEKGKTAKLLSMIQGFPIAERKVSRLCNLSLSILQALEKIDLNLKNWAFMSLDINSTNHFDNANPDEIKIFNTNVSLRVISSCQELTVKLNKITADIDFITNASRSLSPIEYISDSGTLLTTLTLRSIKLKDELRDKVTIAYSKAKLITIGSDLESMLADNPNDESATVASYKQFVVSLLNQLNKAIEVDNTEDRNECLAVISDMEQMFEVFKLERASQKQASDSSDLVPASQEPVKLEPDFSSSPSKFDYSDEYESSDEASTSQSMSSHTQPTVHSITKHSLSRSPDSSYVSKRRESLSSFTSASILHKSTISEELPYLMSAFNSAKTLEEDVHHFKEKEKEKEKETPQKSVSEVPSTPTPKHFIPHKAHLPNTSLYSDSRIIQKPLSSPGAYLYANNSLLSKLGIKPQVISADVPRQLSDSTFVNRSSQSQLPSPGSPPYGYGSALLNGKKDDKENADERPPLTKENLESHTVSSLVLTDALHADFVE
ncbi:hypothetical protein CLUG_00740 [Clavispora lusitaniae ATCC 42720]|uniref:Uncharacterized protein n=1 Tax=Clavispora lusitaniae (strain ATCC 42720) TaxID=306902 RepID=C4XXR8_CLAL4|nr:uncharacterized protein CLUG_00740 [Clavispora lusitaniae ATCC 42720]EEQ36617.1 hypothetical protein CLUG_00740 [Clavispora lusitaniae ATCC 42720]